MQRKILVINNTILYEKKGQLLLNKEVGKFYLELAHLGHEVVIFQISQPFTESDSFANFRVDDKGFTIKNISRKKGRRMWAFVKSFFYIPSLVWKSDFVYIFYPGPICQYIALCSILTFKRYGLYIRGEQGINSRFSQFILKRASIVATISPQFTDIIKKTNDNTHTIRPMIGLTEDDIIKNRKVKNDRKVTALYVGRLVYDKGIFELVDAIRELIASGYEIDLKVVGSGPDEERMKRRVAEYGLSEVVEFTGMISDINQMKKYFLSSDVFILPSYHEGFPRVLYESLIMGLPIITTFVGSIGYLMKDNYNSLKIDKQCSGSISEKTKLFIEDTDLREQLSTNGTKTIIDYLCNKKDTHAQMLSKFINKSDG